MNALPEAYEKYLAALRADDADALRPIFQQSVAEGYHGVSLRGAGSHHEQALIDDRVPFGQIHEGVWDLAPRPAKPLAKRHRWLVGGLRRHTTK